MLMHIALIIVTFGFSSNLFAKIHSAPVIVAGFKIRQAARYPIQAYRLFRSDNGVATSIPFQIDEINQYGDYVLDQGQEVTKNDGNGIFDLQDELAFMGDDVGMVSTPKSWPKGQKPNLIFEIRQTFKDSTPKLKPGAVYLGVYFRKPPPLSKKKYVVFDQLNGAVKTSRYLYSFDKKNYLVVNSVDMYSRSKEPQKIPLIDSSTFYLKADLKYFLTFEIHHKDIQSYLEAYKVGPIRSIVRVTFFYRFLKINFELGMYTELSLFSNSVVLPAIMYNPLDSETNLNDGSGFYYGFATSDNPSTYDIKTNIPDYNKYIGNKSLFDMFSKKPKVESRYWLSMTSKDRMMFFEVIPSKDMLKHDNIPYLYRENTSSKELRASRENTKAQPLGKSPVNLGVYFDLTKFNKGEHRISFRLFFDNQYNAEDLKSYQDLDKWQVELNRL